MAFSAARANADRSRSRSGEIRLANIDGGVVIAARESRARESSQIVIRGLGRPEQGRLDRRPRRNTTIRRAGPRPRRAVASTTKRHSRIPGL